MENRNFFFFNRWKTEFQLVYAPAGIRKKKKRKIMGKEVFCNYGTNRNKREIINWSSNWSVWKDRRIYSFGYGFRSLFGPWCRSGSAQIRNLMLFMRKDSHIKENDGKRGFLNTVRVRIKRGNNIWSSNCPVRKRKRGNTFSDMDLRVFGSDRGLDQDPHGSTRISMDPLGSARIHAA